MRFCGSNRISRPSLALPQTSALLCFIFVVSVSYGTSAFGNDYCTSLGDHISFLSILSPHKQPSTALPRFMATYARGLTSQAVNLTHTTHWSECLMYYVANACSNRNLCNWRVNMTRRHARRARFSTLHALASLSVHGTVGGSSQVMHRGPTWIGFATCDRFSPAILPVDHDG